MSFFYVLYIVLWTSECNLMFIINWALILEIDMQIVIVKLLKGGYVIAVEHSNSLLRASGHMSYKDAVISQRSGNKQAFIDATNYIGHVIAPKDIERKVRAH